MRLPSIPYLLNVFSKVVSRFPIVMLVAFIGTVTVSILIEDNLKDNQNILPKLLLTSLLGLPTTIAAAIAAEKWRLQGATKWLPTLVALVLLVVYYLTIGGFEHEPGPKTMIRFAGLLLFAHLLIAYLPYLDDTPVADFWEYNKRLFGHFVVGAFYSAIIYSGLAIAILAIDNLFELNIQEDVYGHLFVWVAGIFNTAFFLANFPTNFQGLVKEGTPYTTAFKNLSKFILIPIVGIYFLILYAYSVKILATWNLPKGWVASLVLGFSVAGIFTYLLNYLLVNYDKNLLVTGYRKWFFYVLLPMVGLLFVAIGKRIMDYGVTEERFVVAAAGIWLLLMSLYFIFSKKDNIKFIPISLSVFALLTVLGPLNTFRISSNSQASRLNNLLEKNGMLTNGVASPAVDTVAQADAESIRSILHYMREFEHLGKISHLFPGVLDTIQHPSWETVDKMTDVLNIGSIGSPTKNCGFNLQMNNSVDVSGYDKLWKVQVFAPNIEEEGLTGFAIAESKHALAYYENGELRDTIDLENAITALGERYECYGVVEQPADLIFETETTLYRYKIITENVDFVKSKPLQINSWSGIVLAHQPQ